MQQQIRRHHTKRVRDAIEDTESAVQSALQAGIARERSRRLTDAVEALLEAMEDELCEYGE